MSPLSCSRYVTSRSRVRAFTLIELLTVIAIIGVLAAILIPTVGKVRATARKTQCVANLRQWGTAVRLFANDNKGNIALYNKDVDDYAIYSPYFSQKFMTTPSGTRELSQIIMSRCPVALASGMPASDPDYRSRDYAFVKPIDSNKTVKGTSFGITDANNIQIYNLSDAHSPSRLLLMTEVQAVDNSFIFIGAPPDLALNVQPMQVNPAKPHLVRHGGIANVVFLDAHVGSLTRSQTDFAVPANRPTIISWMTLKQ